MLNTGADQPPWRSGLEPPYQLKVYRALSKPLYIFMAMEERKRRLEVEEEKLASSCRFVVDPHWLNTIIDCKFATNVPLPKICHSPIF